MSGDAHSLFVDSAGDLKPVAPADVAGVVQLGWVPASDKQIADFKTQEKFGSVGQQAIAGLEGAGRGLTLGVSTAAERALGVPAEDIAGREAANPITAGVSEGAGVAGSLMIGMGGPSIAAKAGAATAKALVPEAAGVASRILGKAGAVAAGSAVEGAFYGAGHVVHEAALGDPHLTAQSALATVGLSAALLGGVGGAGKLFGEAAKEYAPKMLGEKVTEMLADAEANSNFNATNAMPSKIKGVIRGKGEGAQAIGLEGRDLGILRSPLSDSPDMILDRATELKQAAGTTMDKIAANASEAGPVASWDQIEQDVRGPIGKALRSQGATVPIADQFDRILDNYAQAYAGKELTASDLWTLRKDVGDFIYKNGKVLDPWAKELNTPIKRVYDHVDSLLEKAIGDTGEDAAKAWEIASRHYEVASTFATLAESGIERSAANNAMHLTGTMGAIAGLATHGVGGGALMGAGAEALRRRGASAIGLGARMLRNALEEGGAEVAGRTAEGIASQRQMGASAIEQQASAVPEKVAVLAALERNNNTVKNRIASLTSALVEGGRAETAAIFNLPTDEMRVVYEKRAEEIRRLSDPEELHRALTAQSEAWQEHAPNTAMALGIASTRAVGYLASQIPQPHPRGPLGPKWQPSRLAMSDWLRKYEAVNKPLKSMPGSAPEMQAIGVVHPQLVNAVHAAMIEKLASHKQPVSFQGRIVLSRLMGQDMDGSLNPIAIQRAAQSFAQPPPQPPKGSPAAGKVTLSQRTMTPMQATAERR